MSLCAEGVELLATFLGRLIHRAEAFQNATEANIKSTDICTWSIKARSVPTLFASFILTRMAARPTGSRPRAPQTLLMEFAPCIISVTS